MLEKINQETLVPLGFVVILSISFGFIISMKSSADDQESRLTKIESKQDKYSDDITQIKVELSKLEMMIKEDLDK